MAGSWSGEILDTNYPPEFRVELFLLPADTGYVGLAQWTHAGTVLQTEVVAADYTPPNAIGMRFGEDIPCFYGRWRGGSVPDSTVLTHFSLLLARVSIAPVPLAYVLSVDEPPHSSLLHLTSAMFKAAIT